MHQRAELHFIANLTGGYSCEVPIHPCAYKGTEHLIEIHVNGTCESCKSSRRTRVHTLNGRHSQRFVYAIHALLFKPTSGILTRPSSFPLLKHGRRRLFDHI